MLFSIYIPHPERAIVPAVAQLVIVAILWIALFAYARRWGARRAACMLTLAAVAAPAMFLSIQMAIGLGAYGDLCRGFLQHKYSDAFLITVKFFALGDFAIAAFVGMVIAMPLIPLLLRIQPIRRGNRT